MKKNINLKIVIIFFLVGLILMTGLGLSYMFMLNQLESIGNLQDNTELIDNIQSQLFQTKILLIIFIIGYTIISILNCFAKTPTPVLFSKIFIVCIAVTS